MSSTTPTTEDLSLATLRAVVEALPDGVAVHRDGTIVFVNRAAAEMLGYGGPAELVGRPVLSVVHPDDLPVVRERIQQIVRTGRPTPAREERLLRADGSVLAARVRAIPILWEGAPAVFAFAQDLTEQRRYEDRLAMADRLASVGTLAAGMAHDLNNPLAHLVLSLDLAREVAGPDGPIGEEAAAQIRGRLAGALEAAERIKEIVNDLRVFARQPEGEERVGSVDGPVRSAVDLARNQLRHRCRVEVDLDADCPVRANEGRLVQVFLNLVMNAIQAFPPDRGADRNELRIVTRCTRAGATVTVSDNGAGIAPEHVHRVFEPYFTTKPAGEGTGLGLWMVHGVVERLGGRVSLTSEPGVGTTVTLELPSPAEDRRPSVPPASGPATGTLRILVADDEHEIAGLIADVLRPRHQVDVRTSGRDALAAIRAAEPPYDLVICDVMMPDLAGPELYEALRADGRGLERRLVFATGGAFSVPAQRFLERVRAKVLHKPFRTAEIRELVDGWRPQTR